MIYAIRWVRNWWAKFWYWWEMSEKYSFVYRGCMIARTRFFKLTKEFYGRVLLFAFVWFPRLFFLFFFSHSILSLCALNQCKFPVFRWLLKSMPCEMSKMRVICFWLSHRYLPRHAPHLVLGYVGNSDVQLEILQKFEEFAALSTQIVVCLCSCRRSITVTGTGRIEH